MGIVLLNRQRRAALGHIRRRLAEAVGSERFSHVGDPEVEKRLMEYLPERGYFVEAGANDGLRQSNTYILERRGWDGLLIEPIPELATRCACTRSSTVLNGALVSPEYGEPTIQMMYAGLMSMIVGARGNEAADDRCLVEGEVTQGISRYPVEVPAFTLTHALDEAGAPHVDLLSLDVEGYSVEAIRGLDTKRYCPSVILVEAEQDHVDDITRHLAGSHEFVDWITARDCLFLAS